MATTIKIGKLEIDTIHLLTNHFKKYENETFVLNGAQISNKITSFFSSGNWSALKFDKYIFGLESGITFNNKGIIFFILNKKDFTWAQINKIETVISFIEPDIIKLSNTELDLDSNQYHLKLSEKEVAFLRGFINSLTAEKQRLIDIHNLEKEANKKRIDAKIEEKREREKLRFVEFEEYRSDILKEFANEENGKIELIEGDDVVMNLLKKHQQKIISIDKNYVHNFIKISNYLTIKKGNIQELFQIVQKTKIRKELVDYLGLLKNQIHTYELLTFHAINMIASVIDNDLISFYAIYETFDKLNIFISNFENETADQLKFIGKDIQRLMFSIDSMEANIVNGLNKLTIVTNANFKELNSTITRELKEVDSSIKFNNLLTGISTYQLYKINKQTKGLIE